MSSTSVLRQPLRPSNPLTRGPVGLLLTVVAVLGLAYDAKAHLHLAPVYDAVGTSITQGGLFRVEAVAALIAAVALLVLDDRRVWLVAGLVGLLGVAAVVLYRYVQVPAFGPIPSMYEPVWFGEKTLSAYAEGLVAVAALVREALRHRGTTPRWVRRRATSASAGG